MHKGDELGNPHYFFKKTKPLPFCRCRCHGKKFAFTKSSQSQFPNDGDLLIIKEERGQAVGAETAELGL